MFAKHKSVRFGGSYGKMLGGLNRTQNEILWSSIFHDTITDSSWLKVKKFSPGRAAAGYPMLYILYRILNDVKPRKILEFGMGESTKLLYQYAKSHEECELTLVEQSEEWLGFFENEIFPVREYTHICPIEKRLVDGVMTNVYAGLENVVKDNKYDLIIIDGPSGSRKLSRTQMMDMVEHNIDRDNFIVILDDVHRKGERRTFEKSFNILKKAGKEPVYGVYAGKKYSAVMCSRNYTYIPTL